MYPDRVEVKDGGEGAVEAFPRRAASARRTHAALVTAAAELFARDGYAATTVQAIARRAGVARPTLFTSVPGGKPQLLKEARDVALAGDDAPVPIPQRPWLLEAMAQQDPYELLRLQSGNYRRMHERAAALEHALAVAAASEPELAELASTARRQRHWGAGMVITRLAELDAVHPRLTAALATDTLYALSAPALYLLLTRDRGWDGDAYAAWLTDELQRSLLR